MHTHRVARLVAILLFLAAPVYFCGGMAVGLPLWSRGLGEGWGSGFSGWLAIPILAATVFGAIVLLVFGPSSTSWHASTRTWSRPTETASFRAPAGLAASRRCDGSKPAPASCRLKPLLSRLSRSWWEPRPWRRGRRPRPNSAVRSRG